MRVIAPLLFCLLFCTAALMAGDKTIYDFTLNSIDGQPAPLAAYKGHVVMLVNVASRCGFTPQYTALESIYEKYKDRGFVIVGIPANNFGSQEPGTNQEIKTFCSSKYLSLIHILGLCCASAALLDVQIWPKSMLAQGHRCLLYTSPRGAYVHR